MNTKISGIVSRIVELERELEQEFAREVEEKRLEFQYLIEKGKIVFRGEACALHKQLRQGVLAFLWQAPVVSLLVWPVIDSLIVRIVLVDCWLWLYQAAWFPVDGIAQGAWRREVVLGRRH